MKLKQRKSGWLFYCMVFIFLAAGLASIDLTFDRSIRRHFMVAIDSFLAKKLDLAEPVSASQLAGILTRLPGAVIRGEFPARFDDLSRLQKRPALSQIQRSATVAPRANQAWFQPILRPNQCHSVASSSRIFRLLCKF